MIRKCRKEQLDFIDPDQRRLLELKPIIIYETDTLDENDKLVGPKKLGQSIQVAGNIASDLETLGGGVPRTVITPKGATQFIFPNGMIMRFDLAPGQYLRGQMPHINLEGPWGNQHIDLK